jgi:hypothetical protein
MPCNQNCNQGRDCNCSRAADRSTVIVVTLLLLAILAMAYGVYKLLATPTTGMPCSIEVQFKDSKATYIGKSV